MKKFKKCTVCGNQNSERAKFCPKCGEPKSKTSILSNKKIVVVLSIILLLLISIILVNINNYVDYEKLTKDKQSEMLLNLGYIKNDDSFHGETSFDYYLKDTLDEQIIITVSIFDDTDEGSMLISKDTVDQSFYEAIDISNIGTCNLSDNNYVEYNCTNRNILSFEDQVPLVSIFKNQKNSELIHDSLLILKLHPDEIFSY